MQLHSTALVGDLLQRLQASWEASYNILQAYWATRGVTYVKTYVNMREQQIVKWTHISEVHDDTLISDLLRSEPCPEKHTLF